MRENPIISVVMPVYNREQYLKESIESILKQTFTDFEFIIVDDQSTDSSWQIIQEYAKKDSRIIAVKNSGIKGCWAARNKGWDLAKGKYMAIMDSDDISVSERLQQEFDFMEQNPDIDICGSWIEHFEADNKIITLPRLHHEIKDLMFFSDSISQPSAMIRLSSFEKLHLRYSNNIAEDYELWSRAINKLKFANIPEVLLFYRVHANQTGSAQKYEQNSGANDVRLRNLKNIGMELSVENQKIYCDFFSEQFNPKNIEEIISAIKIFEQISIKGKKYGYGENFQELIDFYQKKATDCGILNNVTSLKTYFTLFRKLKKFKSLRTRLRYIYHCVRNLLCG